MIKVHDFTVRPKKAKMKTCRKCRFVAVLEHFVKGLCKECHDLPRDFGCCIVCKDPFKLYRDDREVCAKKDCRNALKRIKRKRRKIE